jgi:hypothetical protein
MTPARAEQDVGQLPAELAALVRRVIKATRLRRGERADVMAELTSHFEEALASGRSAAQAMDEFGDPKVAARALRAAAIAKRSALDRALSEMLRWTGWAVAATVLAYAGFVAYLSLQAPAISMDALAALAERTAKPATPDDDAWPVYRRAFLELNMGVEPKARDDAAKEAVDRCPWPGMWKGLPPDPWPLAAAWVDGHATAIAMLRAATMRPMGSPSGAGWMTRTFRSSDRRRSTPAAPSRRMRRNAPADFAGACWACGCRTSEWCARRPASWWSTRSGPRRPATRSGRLQTSKPSSGCRCTARIRAS